jgi:prefoldin alpha subunit
MDSGKKEVPLDQLSVEQLQYVQKQVEQEINQLSTSYTSLKLASAKFSDNRDYLKDFVSSGDKEILVPLTNSVYIPGRSSDVKSVMIEVGASYFIDTNMDNADKCFDRKITMIKENMDKFDKLLQQKTNIMTSINNILFQKTASQQKK